MDVDSKVQLLSDAFHKGLDEIDQLMFSSSERLQLAIQVRIESGMMGRDGQATIKRMTSQLSDLSLLREKHVIAHSSAEKDAETADLPWECPDEANSDNVVELQVVDSQAS